MLVRDLKFTTAILLASLISTGNISAQISELVPGDSVRFILKYSLMMTNYGSIDTVTDSAIIIQSVSDESKSWKLLYTELDELEVKRSTNKGAQGALVGGVVGAILLGTVTAGMPNLNDSEDPGFMGGAAIGGMFGALMGSLTGSEIKVQKWEKVNLKDGFKYPKIKRALNPSITFPTLHPNKIEALEWMFWVK